MLYHITFWEHGKNVSDLGEVRADTLSKAFALAGTERNDGTWRLEEDADGAGSLVDPTNDERLYQAIPLEDDSEPRNPNHCSRCGALLRNDGLCGECVERHLDRITGVADDLMG